MRLTKSDKQAFVKAVMNDVPSIDFNKMARDLVVEEVLRAMNPKVKAVYDDKDLKDFLETAYIPLPGRLQNFRMNGAFGFKMPEELKAKLEELSALLKKQEDDFDALEEKLSAIIEGCSTLKVAKERLPEFEAYLPADRDGTGVKSLPAISNVVSELTKAGWPKGEKK